MTRAMEHCDDMLMEHCDDKNSGALCGQGPVLTEVQPCQGCGGVERCRGDPLVDGWSSDRKSVV